MPRCLELLKPGGQIIISDCFRAEGMTLTPGESTVGGGHPIAEFRARLEAWPVEVISEADITEATAPSVEVEQGLFNVLGFAFTRVDEDLQQSRPRLRWMLSKLLNALVSESKRARLDQRLNQQTRNRTVFIKNNVYLMMDLRASS